MVDHAEREPLHNFEAEQAVLGALLVNNAVYHQLEDFLSAEAFTDGLHRKLFTTLARLIERGQVASPVTMRGYFSRATPICARPAAWATSPSWAPPRFP